MLSKLTWSKSRDMQLGINVGAGLDFINGYAFLERFYTVYDVTNQRIGFAPTSNTDSTSN